MATITAVLEKHWTSKLPRIQENDAGVIYNCKKCL